MASSSSAPRRSSSIVRHVGGLDAQRTSKESRVRTGNAPAVLAAIRNLVITALHLAEAVNIAAAGRAAALDPAATIQLFRRDRNQDKRS